MSKAVQKLAPYAKRRDFKKTSEPIPRAKSSRASKKREPIFVIQEHHASHLHWDLRLEIDGVLKSWAIPKGPSTNPKEKRLAVLTEDHPMDYAMFEGTIPEGLYGAGTVMVWDIGTYTNKRSKDGESIPMNTCFDAGRIDIVLHGKKLKGGYALIRFKTDKNWLFFKLDDEYASTVTVTQKLNKSAVTGRRIDEIAQNPSGSCKGCS